MRQMFPEGRGGPFDVPGVGRVIEGEEFDYPDLVAGCVPVEDGGDEDAPGAGSPSEPGAGEAKGGEDEGAGSRTEPQKPRARGNRP